MLVLYAKRHTFLDMNVGIRQEVPWTVMIFSAGLASVITEVRLCASCRLPGSATSKCFGCQTEATREAALKKCSHYNLATYCGRDCQRKHRKQTHKRLCGQAQTLSKLAATVFSNFDGYLDWSFQREVLSDEQKKERAVDARHGFVRRATGMEPLSKPERLGKVLEYIKNKTIPDLFGANWHTRTNGLPPLFKTTLQSDFFVKLELNRVFVGLQELSAKVAASDDQDGAFHIMDMRQPSYLDIGLLESYEHYSDSFFSYLFFSIPTWQQQLSILDLVWAVTMDICVDHKTILADAWWDIKAGPFFTTARYRGDIRLLCSDEMSLLCPVVNELAKRNPRVLVVRVLRVLADESQTSYARQVALSPTPKNIITLWIREDTRAGSKFRISRPTQSLADQLVDFKALDITHSMLRMMGISDHQIIGRDDDQD
jgi:hypothetical protein